MKRIESLSDLKRAWSTIIGTFGRDLSIVARLAHDPIAAMNDMGYDLSDEAASALVGAMP